MPVIYIICVCACVCVSPSVVFQLFVNPLTQQAPLSMGFSRQEYWSGLPFPSPGDLPNSGVEPRSPGLQADSLLYEPPWKPSLYHTVQQSYHNFLKDPSKFSSPAGPVPPKPPCSHPLCWHPALLFILWKYHLVSPWCCNSATLNWLMTLRFPQLYLDFPGGTVVNLPPHAGDVSSISGLGRSSGGGNDNPLQYSCRGAWWATVRWIAKSWTWLSNWAHTEWEHVTSDPTLFHEH